MDWQPRVQDFVRPHGSLTGDGSIEESLLGLPDLRLLPLLDVVLVNLEVDPLNLFGRLDLDATEEDDDKGDGYGVVDDGDDDGAVAGGAVDMDLGGNIVDLGDVDGNVEIDVVVYVCVCSCF